MGSLFVIFTLAAGGFLLVAWLSALLAPRCGIVAMRSELLLLAWLVTGVPILCLLPLVMLVTLWLGVYVPSQDDGLSVPEVALLYWRLYVFLGVGLAATLGFVVAHLAVQRRRPMTPVSRSAM